MSQGLGLDMSLGGQLPSVSSCSYVPDAVGKRRRKYSLYQISRKSFLYEKHGLSDTSFNLHHRLLVDLYP